MFKKILIGCALLAVSGVAMAADGAYVGGALGLNLTTFKLTDPASAVTHFTNREPTLGALAGYGQTFNDILYLGGEAFVNGGSASTSTKTIFNGTQTAKLASTYNYGIDLMPGLKVTPSTLVYGKVGLSENRFKLTENLAPGVGSGVSGTAQENRLGGRLGLGAQTDLTSNLAIRGEFVHTAYRSFTAPSNAGFQNSIKPSTNTATVGLVYTFD